ncbi:hypothetical protein Leryth_007131 [Lithospermum erythrorhizon]|nr:hypothetical protein Leryth_007131 [Lithospermum erythrorhizon]
MLTRVSRRVLSMATLRYLDGLSSSLVGRCALSTLPLVKNPEKLKKREMPFDMVKWRSLGCVRTSKFASGFTPLKLKSLGSIMDVERAKTKSPKELADVWDDFHLGRGHIGTTMSIQMPCILFTGLEDYKARGTQAAPYFTVTHYKEFADSKDLVLIRGDVVFASKLSDSEAKWLLETAQSFYLNDVRYKLVERFNKQTHDFEFKDVLKALEMPIL